MASGYNQQNVAAREFLQQIKTIESTIKNYLQISDDQYLSQIRYSENYDPLITTKIKSYKQQIKTTVSGGNLATIFDLTKNCQIRCQLEFGNIWKSNSGKYVTKLMVNHVELKTA